MPKRSVSDPSWHDEVSRLIAHGRDREAAELAARQLHPQIRGATMDPRTQLDEILPLVDNLVASLEPGQLDAPTPCSEFAVRDILEHMVGGATMFAAAFRGEPPATPDTSDLVTAFPLAMADLRAAVSSPGALERTVAAPFGEVPGETFARFVALDGLVHGWDIATATGQSYEPPAEVVSDVASFARVAITEDLRGQIFAAAVAAPAGAPPIVELVAFTGRQV